MKNQVSDSRDSVNNTPNKLFSKGDKVRFHIGAEQKLGEVFIVDAHGTFEKPGIPSYDILVDSENTLYKHVDWTIVYPVSCNINTENQIQNQ